MSPPMNDGLQRIEVQGFKCLSSRTGIDVRPLTILAGANSSGKSSIVQPLLMLKQTMDSPYDPGALLLDGPHVRFTSADQLLTQRSPNREFSVQLSIFRDSSEFRFKHDGARGFELKEQTTVDIRGVRQSYSENADAAKIFGSMMKIPDGARFALRRV